MHIATATTDLEGTMARVLYNGAQESRSSVQTAFGLTPNELIAATQVAIGTLMDALTVEAITIADIADVAVRTKVANAAHALLWQCHEDEGL